MPNRVFKHLLGESSVEQRCRFVFGLGILVLVHSMRRLSLAKEADFV